MSRLDLRQFGYGCKDCNEIYTYEQTGKNETCKKCGKTTKIVDYKFVLFWPWLIVGILSIWFLDPFFKDYSLEYFLVSIAVLVFYAITGWIMYRNAKKNALAKLNQILNEDSPRPRP